MQPISQRPLRALRHLATLFLHLSICATLVAASAQEDDDAASVRWYDVRALEAAALEDPEGVDLRLHLSSAFLDRLEPDHYDVQLEDSPSLRDQGWSGLLWDCLGDGWEDDAFSVEERAGFLRVDGHAATHAELASILADLEAHHLQEFDIELYVLAPQSVPSGQGALLDAAEADALIARATVLDHARSSARTGQRLRLGVPGADATLIDYDVEVASTSRAADPQVTVLRAGTELGVLVRPCAGGGLYVRAWGRRGARQQDTPRAELGAFAGAPIEQPAMSLSLCAGSARIADGGGLLLGQDWNAQGVWLVRARSRSVADDAARLLRFVPLGALTTRPLIVAPPRPEAAAPSGGAQDVDEPFASQLGDAALEPAFQAEDVAEELRELQAEEALEGAIYPLADALYVRGSEALLERARAHVGAWSERLSPGTVEVELRYGILARTRALELLAAPDPDRTQLAAALERRLLGTCRLGDALLLVGGSERFYLQDHDVEIAERSAIPDPILEMLFEGVVLWCLPTRAPSGALSSWFDLLVQTPARETKRIAVADWQPPVREPLKDEPTASPGSFQLASEIELPATARAGLRTRTACTDGAWTLLGCTPLGGSDQSLVVIARLSLVPAR